MKTWEKRIKSFCTSANYGHYYERNIGTIRCLMVISAYTTSTFLCLLLFPPFSNWEYEIYVYVMYVLFPSSSFQKIWIGNHHSTAKSHNRRYFLHKTIQILHLFPYMYLLLLTPFSYLLFCAAHQLLNPFSLFRQLTRDIFAVYST